MKKKLNFLTSQLRILPIAVFLDTAQAGKVAAQCCKFLNSELLENYGDLQDVFYLDSGTDKKRHIQVYCKDYATRVNDPDYLNRVKEAEGDGDHNEQRRKKGS